MIEAYKDMFVNYVNFSGRASRGDYWWVVLCQIILCVIAYVILIAGVLAGSSTLVVVVYGILLLYAVATLIPTLALTVRRLHDTDRSGWFAIMGYIPCLNIVLLVFMILEGTPGPNRYGEPNL